MQDRRRGWRALVAVGVAALLLVAAPRRAQADSSHEGVAAPFMFVAAAFATAMIVLAVSQSGDTATSTDTAEADTTPTDGTGAASVASGARLGFAPVARRVTMRAGARPGRPPVGGGTRQHLTLCLGFSGQF